MTEATLFDEGTSQPRRGPGRREGDITLAGLKTFVAVAEARSFSAAAATLGVSQPTVSVQLASLEQSCGVLLLHRKPEPRLTDAGRELFVRARLALSRVEEFAASVREIKTMQRGQLTLGFSTPHVALPILASFMAAHPAIRVDTRIGNTSTLLDDIGRCRIDLGVMSLVERPAQLACVHVVTPKLLICMRRDDPLAGRAAITAADLAGRRLIQRETGSMTRAVMETWFAEAGVEAVPVVEIPSREAVKEAVAAGIGVGAVFDCEFADDVRLVGAPLDPQPAAHGVYAVSLRESVGIPAVEAFLAHLAALGPSQLAAEG